MGKLHEKVDFRKQEGIVHSVLMLNSPNITMRSEQSSQTHAAICRASRRYAGVRRRVANVVLRRSPFAETPVRQCGFMRTHTIDLVKFAGES